VTRNEQGRREDRAVARVVARTRKAMTPAQQAAGAAKAARVRAALRTTKRGAA
jgi:hypothetical protein